MSGMHQIVRRQKLFSRLLVPPADALRRAAFGGALVGAGWAWAGVSDNLAVHYRLDETDAGVFTVDNAAPGAAEDGVRTAGFTLGDTGVVGAAYNHGATNDSILIGTEIASLLMQSDKLSISAWVNPSFYRSGTNAASRHTIVAANSSLSFSLYGSGNLFFNFRGAPGTDDGTGSIGANNLANGLTAPLNQYSHVAATRDGSTVSLYINGILVAQKGTASTGNTLITTFDHDANPATPNTAALFATQIFPTATSTREFRGAIDELGIWAGKALSHREIAAVAGLSGLTGAVDLGSSAIDSVLGVFDAQTGSAAAGGFNWSFTDAVAVPDDASTLFVGKHYLGNDNNRYIILDGSPGLFTGVTTAVVPPVALATWDGGGNGAWSGGPNWEGDLPPSFTSAAPSLLIYESAGQSVNNDVADAVIAGIRFEPSAGAFTFTGNGFTVIPGASRFITNNSASLQTFSTGPITLSGAGVNAADGPIVINSDIDTGASGATSLRAGAALTIHGKISGAGLIQKRDAGTLTLTNATSDFTGTLSILDGTVAVTQGGALGAPAGTVATAGGAATGRLRLDGSMTVAKPFAIAGRSGTVDAHAPSVVSAGSTTLSGDISLGAGGTLASIVSESGKLTLSGSVSAASSGVTLLLDGAGEGEISGAITNGGGSIALVKAGSGTWLISSAGNSYSGNTDVLAGTLKVAGAPIFSSNAPRTTITVAAGATLDVTGIPSYEMQIGQTLRGSGVVRAGTLIAYDDNSIKPGDGPAPVPGVPDVGTLVVEGKLALLNQFAPPAPGGNLTFDLASSSAEGGGANDLIDVTGDLELSSSAGDILVNVNPTEGFLAAGDYQIIRYGGARLGSAGYVVAMPRPASDYRVLPTVDETPAGHVDLVVPAGMSLEITWAGDGSANAWDVDGASNFNAGAEKFYNADRVTFDDSSANRMVSITESVFPGSVLVTGTQDLTWTGTGSATFSGTGRLLKAGSNNLTMTNTTVGTFNTAFTGVVEIAGGTLSVAHIGQLSQVTTPDRLILDGGALQFVGPATSNTGRQFSLGAAGGTLSNAGGGTQQFNNATGVVGFVGSGPRVLGLSGIYAGINNMGLLLGDGPGGATSVVKSGPTGWNLSDLESTFTGGITVQDGTLLVQRVPGGPVSVEAGTLRVVAKGVVNSPTGTSVVTSLTLSSGVFDLTNNALVIDYAGASPIDALRADLGAGRLLSSTPGAGQRLGYGEAAVTGQAGGIFAGQPVDATALLVTLALAGDANLDGAVDVADLGILATNWQAPGVWTDADFDYSGAVDVSDLGDLASNWQAGVTGPIEALSFERAKARLGLTGALAPEPGALAWAVLALAAALPRRTRR